MLETQGVDFYPDLRRMRRSSTGSPETVTRGSAGWTFIADREERFEGGLFEFNEKQSVDKSTWRGKMRLHWYGPSGNVSELESLWKRLLDNESCFGMIAASLMGTIAG